ncbi:MAG: hypothetical protein L6Q92_06910 [Phycisphaerae bacterium]|nr:hypothetical protein [Phycisphaerae bacterium]
MTQTACRTDIERFCARLATLVGPHASAAGTAIVARAPAIVDVMGGIVEEAGGLALQGALDVAVAAAAASNADGRLNLCRLSQHEEPRELALPAAVVVNSDPLPAPTDGEAGSTDLKHLAPAIIALLRRIVRELPHARFPSGLTLILQSDWPSDAQIDLVAPLLAAIAEAVVGLESATIDAMSKAEWCRAALSQAGRSSSLRVPLAALLAEPESLLLVRTRPHPTHNALELPDGVAVVALDTELARPVSTQRHRDTLLSAAMGHCLIQHLIRSDGQAVDADGSFLANVTPTEFVERFRDRVPTRMTGRAFVETYGGSFRDVAQVRAEKVYKIRSRVEHFIYENHRVHEFATTIARARRTSDPAALHRAGELMYASHWSYSQRCGIGAVETDQIATAVRAAGKTLPMYGAKVTGFGGSGGMVVLMADRADCHETLNRILTDFTSRTGRKTRIFHGAAPGAERFGTRRLDPAAAPAVLA